MYLKRGFSEEDANILSNILIKDKQSVADILLKEELDSEQASKPKFPKLSNHS